MRSFLRRLRFLFPAHVRVAIALLILLFVFRDEFWGDYAPTVLPYETPALAALALILAVRLAASYRLRSTVQHLGHNDHLPRDVCLILRPFASDGLTVIRRARRSPWLQIWVALLTLGLQRSMTLEEIIRDEMRHHLGCRTVALVSPRSRLLAPGVDYLRANGIEWQKTVKDLLRHSRIVILVLPAGVAASEAMSWEIEIAGSPEVRQRTIVLVPPAKGAIHGPAFQEILSRWDREAGENLDAVVACVDTGDRIRMWGPEDKEKLGKLDSLSYRAILKAALEEIGTIGRDRNVIGAELLDYSSAPRTWRTKMALTVLLIAACFGFSLFLTVWGPIPSP